MKITHNMIYKVCRGVRNLSTEKAVKVAELTGTDPLIWMRAGSAKLRERHYEFLANTLLK